jgi:hypothetical protein
MSFSFVSSTKLSIVKSTTGSVEEHTTVTTKKANMLMKIVAANIVAMFERCVCCTGMVLLLDASDRRRSCKDEKLQKHII